MFYIFFNIYPNAQLLLAKDLPREYVDTLISNTDVVMDDSFDNNSAIDAAILDAADKLLKDFEAHHVHAEIGITRKFPRASLEYKLVLELPRKISGMESYVSRFFRYSRIEYQELLSLDEIMNQTNDKY